MTPIGSPLVLRANGRLIDGWPVRFIIAVNGAKRPVAMSVWSGSGLANAPMRGGTVANVGDSKMSYDV
jgi:hypothetical protein